jgi:hypothetical protein
MGSEIQPGVMKAQKREILISHVKKILNLGKKNYFQYGTGSLFYNYSANLF